MRTRPSVVRRRSSELEYCFNLLLLGLAYTKFKANKPMQAQYQGHTLKQGLLRNELSKDAADGPKNTDTGE
jgi:hypothetical protein